MSHLRFLQRGFSLFCFCADRAFESHELPNLATNAPNSGPVRPHAWTSPSNLWTSPSKAWTGPMVVRPAGEPVRRNGSDQSIGPVQPIVQKLGADHWARCLRRARAEAAADVSETGQRQRDIKLTQRRRNPLR